MDSLPGLGVDRTLTVAERWFVAEVYHGWTGRKVKFVRTVERDSFKVPAGRVATVMTPFLANGHLVFAVKLATPLPGTEPYEGEVHWIEGQNLSDMHADIRFS